MLSDPASVGRRALAVARTEGAKSVAVKTLAATCWSRLGLFAFSLGDPFPVISSPLQLDLGLLGPHDAEAHAALVGDASPEQVRGRLRRGELCFTAHLNGELIAVSWTQTGTVPIPYLRGTLELADGDTVNASSWVAPPLRGKNVHPVLSVHRLGYLRDAGYKRVIAAVLPENAPALRLCDKLGYEKIGVAYGVGLGSRRRVIVARRRISTAGR
jgi:GNAT superfamily N-acetyltransferase